MTQNKGNNLFAALIQHPAMFGFSFLYIWLIVGIFGLIGHECARFAGLDLVLVALAPFAGLVAMSVLLRFAPKLADIPNGLAAALFGLLCLLPSLYLFYSDVAGIPLVAAVSAVFSFFAGCAASCACVAWQAITVKLPLNNFILTEGVTTFIGCFAGGIVLLAVPQLLWPLICILVVILSFGLLNRARLDAESVPAAQRIRRFRSDQVLAHIDKRIRVLFLLFAVLYGIGWCYAIFASMAGVGAALIAGAVTTAVIVVVQASTVGVSDRFVIHLIRACLAGCMVAFFLYYLGFGVTRSIALSLLIVLWLVFWAIDNSLQLQQSAMFGIHIAVHGAAAKIINNGGFLLGWAIGLAALMLEGRFPLIKPGVLLACGILLLVLGIWLIPLGNYESPDKILDRLSAAKAAPTDTGVDDVAVKIALAVKQFQITAREREVLGWLLRGRTAKTIAEQLEISEATAKTHIYNIYRKMDVHTQQDLISLIEEL